MVWFLIAIFGYTAQSLVFILDKIILSKSLAKPVVYTFYSTIYFFIALLVIPFGVIFPKNLFHWFLFFVSGLSFGFGLWTMFIAVKKGEASHINPFIGAVITVITYILSTSLLSEKLNDTQVIGIIILVFASIILSFEKSKKNAGIHIGFVWAVLSGIFFSLSHVSAKYIYDIYPFLTGFVWTRSTTGFLGLFVLFFPSVRNSFSKKIKKPKTYEKKHAIGIVFLDKVLALVAIVSIQYAISIGSVTLVNAMSGIQFALMFIIIYFSTKFSPKLFNEYFTRKELLLETFAIAFILLGSAMLVL